MEKNMEKDPIADLFEALDGQWDLHEPDAQHHDRFLARQTRKRSQTTYRYFFAIAASVVLLVGFFTFLNNNNLIVGSNEKSLQFASKQTRETDSIFTAMIRAELAAVKAKNNPINEQIVADALVQMEALDKDYEKIKAELLRNGESKQIIHAMIRNLKTRISFLEDVLEHLENNEKLNNTTHENTI